MSKGKWAAVAAGCWMIGSVQGAGFQLYTEGSAEALGQAGAISGRTNLTSLAWYNPSALAGAERPQVMLGSAFASIKTDFNSSVSPTLNATMSDDWRVIPHFYYVQPLADDFTAMLSVNAPYGLITEWPDGWAGSPAAVYSDLTAIYTTPSIAYRLNDDISISAGLNVVYAEAELSAFRGPLGNRRITGDDVALGYMLSGHAQSEDWGLGLRFQSRVKLEPEGSIRYDNNPGFGNEFDAKGFVELPATVNFGIANTSLEGLSLGFDVVWTEWSSYDQLVFEFPSNPYEASPEVTPKLWKDVFSIRFGGEYAINENWDVRAGYVFDESPVNNFTRAPELPGSDRHMLTTGLGWQWNNIGIDVAYSFLWAKKTQTGAGVVAAVPTSAGEFETTTHLVALSASYTF